MSYIFGTTFIFSGGKSEGFPPSVRLRREKWGECEMSTEWIGIGRVILPVGISNKQEVVHFIGVSIIFVLSIVEGGPSRAK